MSSPAPAPQGPIPSFNASALSIDLASETGLTFNTCVVIVESVINDPNFQGVNDDDVRNILGMNSKQLLAQNAYLGQALYDVVKIISQFPTAQPNQPFYALAADARTYIEAVNPEKFTF